MSARGARALAGRRGRRIAGALAAALLACAGAAPAAAYEVTTFDANVASPSGATSAVQAGGHPDLTLAFGISAQLGPGGWPVPEENVKDVEIDLPGGLYGSPGATPACASAQLATPAMAACPIDSQVGVVDLQMGFDPLPMRVPLYNLGAGPDAPAQFGFNAQSVAVRVVAGLRSGADQGLTARIRNLSQSLPVVRVSITLWGVPADPAHDADRFDPAMGAPGVPSTVPRRPLVTYPASCTDAAPAARLRLRSWQRQDVWLEQSAALHAAGEPPQGTTGCERLDFAPALDAQPDVRRRGAPTGFAVNLGLAQDANPDGLATGTLRRAVIALPPGVVLSPAGANGLGACAAGEIGLADGHDATCPAASRLGDVELATSLLPEPLRGSLFLARPHDGPFAGQLGVYVVVRGAGAVIKLAGQLVADPASGQLTATFDDLPQLPLERLTMRFDGGPAALLALPVACGPATTVATLASHGGGAPVVRTSTFEVSRDGDGAPCPPRGFSPGFVAGSSNAIAGRDATFSLRLTRGDEDQELGGFAAALPPGLMGRIADVPVLCTDARAAAGSCDEGSRVGSVAIGAGPGPAPAVLPGRVHLTGPYRGAPFGLSIVVPAVAGPLDLGTVVLRAAIEVDRRDASLRVVADPLPTTLAGIPLQVRSVDLTLDRPGLVRNPTSCAPAIVGGEVRSAEGAVATVSTRHAVGECAALAYAPRLALTAGRRGRTSRGAVTPLHVRLRMAPGEAGNRAVTVALPDTLNARLPVLNRACTPADLAAARCGSRIGDASVVTPVLRDPLRGAMYLVWDPAQALPELVVQLRGQLALDLRGTLRIPRGRRISTAFEALPDVPISRLDLRFAGGRNGALGTNADLCSADARRRDRAQLRFRAQSGRRVEHLRRMRVTGCAATRPRR